MKKNKASKLAPIKLIFVLKMIALYSVTALASGAIPGLWRRTGVRAKLIGFWSKVGLRVLNIKVNVEGSPNFDGAKLYVSNHLSYLDVLVISSVFPTCFVTSVEVKETPGLGELCRWGGCLFVERRSRAKLRTETDEIASGLKHGLNVTIFPEATSTNGEDVIRFKRPLYYSAIKAEVPVQPFCINYETLSGKPVDLGNRDKLFWYGDMSFFPHMMDLMKESGATVTLKFLSQIDVSSESEPHDLAVDTHKMVKAAHRPPQGVNREVLV